MTGMGGENTPSNPAARMAANFFAQIHSFSAEGYCRNDHIVANRWSGRFGPERRGALIISSFYGRAVSRRSATRARGP